MSLRGYLLSAHAAPCAKPPAFLRSPRRSLSAESALQAGARDPEDRDAGAEARSTLAAGTSCHLPFGRRSCDGARAV
eukprot:scaffold136796_cov127-Phaeocystis_antarctica.AAC.1